MKSQRGKHVSGSVSASTGTDTLLASNSKKLPPKLKALLPQLAALSPAERALGISVLRSLGAVHPLHQLLSDSVRAVVGNGVFCTSGSSYEK